MVRFAVATEPGVVGKSYESEVRDAIKAPTQGGFYYATDAVKVKLPYADTGELTLEVTRESAPGKGCCITFLLPLQTRDKRPVKP